MFLVGMSVVLAAALSVQALALLRERSTITQHAMAAQLDEMARTATRRVETRVLRPMATALGRAAFSDASMNAAPSASAIGAFVRKSMARVDALRRMGSPLSCTEARIGSQP